MDVIDVIEDADECEMSDKDEDQSESDDENEFVDIEEDELLRKDQNDEVKSKEYMIKIKKLTK